MRRTVLFKAIHSSLGDEGEVKMNANVNIFLMFNIVFANLLSTKKSVRAAQPYVSSF